MPPSVNSALHPIVIPEIQVPPHFTTLGSCLLHSGHPRESPATLATLLLPSPSSPRGITNNSKPKTWWRAQCLLYGIDMPLSANIERMRTKLEEGLRSGPGGRGGRWGLVVPEALVELEYKYCGEFRKLNAQVREKVSPQTAQPKGKAAEKGKTVEKGKTAGKAAAGRDSAIAQAAPAAGAKRKGTSATIAQGGEPQGKKQAKTTKKAAEETVTTTVKTVNTTTTKKSTSTAGPAKKSGSGAGSMAPASKTGKPHAKKMTVGVSKPKAKQKLKNDGASARGSEWGQAIIKNEGTYFKSEY